MTLSGMYEASHVLAVCVVVPPASTCDVGVANVSTALAAFEEAPPWRDQVSWVVSQPFEHSAVQWPAKMGPRPPSAV